MANGEEKIVLQYQVPGDDFTRAGEASADLKARLKRLGFPAAAVRKARSAIRKAFEYSEKNIGLSFVEIVATCNSGWKMSPVDANKWMVENMFRKYPVGDIKDVLK